MADEVVAIEVSEAQRAFLEGRYHSMHETGAELGWFLPDDEILYAVYCALPVVQETRQP